MNQLLTQHLPCGCSSAPSQKLKIEVLRKLSVYQEITWHVWPKQSKFFYVLLSIEGGMVKAINVTDGQRKVLIYCCQPRGQMVYLTQNKKDIFYIRKNKYVILLWDKAVALDCLFLVSHLNTARSLIRLIVDCICDCSFFTCSSLLAHHWQMWHQLWKD